MLRSANELFNYKLAAKDGEIGRCMDFLFDDDFWTIRYMVAGTGKWLPGKRVLISPLSLGEPRWQDKIFPVWLTREQIEQAPGIDEHASLTRQYEKKLAKYYGYPPYWAGPNAWANYDTPVIPVNRDVIKEKLFENNDLDDDIHLRSSKEVLNYHIHASDGDVGHVKDFILDDFMWTLRYLVVDPRSWLPGRKVLITPLWVELVEWFDQKVQVNLTVEEIKNSPPYDPSAPVNREYEERLYDFYGRPKYWA